MLPEKIRDGGLIILRDGDPGEPEQALGGFGSTYYQHAVEIEVYVEEGDAAARDAAFDALLQQIGAALEADPTIAALTGRIDVRFIAEHERRVAEIEALRVQDGSNARSGRPAGHAVGGGARCAALVAAGQGGGGRGESPCR